MDKGPFEVVHLGDMTSGRAISEPGWRGSDGRRIETRAGCVFHIGVGHDSSVAAGEPIRR